MENAIPSSYDYLPFGRWGRMRPRTMRTVRARVNGAAGNAGMTLSRTANNSASSIRGSAE